VSLPDAVGSHGQGGDLSPSWSWAGDVAAAQRGRVPKRKRVFEVEIEAKLNVLAFDEESARKKVERALGAGRNVGADVESTGVVWT
jgi:hypothetical protein